MGRESRAYWLDSGDRAAVTLRLEWDALTVRGARRATVPRTEFRRVDVTDGVVELEAASGAQYRFQVGQAASDWAEALARPPRPLDEKLGVGPDVAVAVRGALPVTALADALVDSPRVAPWEADLVFAVVHDDAALDTLPVWLQETGVVAPLWVIHGKGRHCPAPGDAAVREVMRDAGRHETATSAIAECWSAIRYAPGKP
ncbi:hypothetical protein FLP10_11745 [Agromyces intestinalis]|uniref:Uncharacterized protein n=1 Tax=Agromyces intestinalis TaxID=2592652 RepID=A0A5C1YJL3_9MICO|nr:hypothetical protein [Agromyces intestinalis]QEO15012.1 hypothetical protein FLP10_11745 [Agromyces intestinalis]